MEKINFVNGQSPYISATNLNNLQDNVENAINGIKKEITTGQEYATNEYIDGKRVYEKIVKTTTIINGGETTTVAHGITGANKIWVDLSNSYFRATSNNMSYPLPMLYYNAPTVEGIQIFVDLTNINFISAGGWATTWEKVVRLKYTKN